MSPFEMISSFWNSAVRPFIQFLMNNYIPHSQISFFVLLCVPLVFDLVLLVIKYIVHGQVASDDIREDAHPEIKQRRQYLRAKRGK